MASKIVIVGDSCTGKTSIAKELEKNYGFIRFSCGEELKNKASEIGLKSHRELPVSAYLEIDAIAEKFLKGSSNIVVEGRYIGKLNSTPQGVFIVSLLCSDSIRKRRLFNRKKSIKSYDPTSINVNVIELYEKIDILDQKPDLICHTDNASIENVAKFIHNESIKA